MGIFFGFAFHVFVKHNLILDWNTPLLPWVFSPSFYFFINGNIDYISVSLCNRWQFYRPKYISTCSDLYETCLVSQFFILKVINNKSFYRLILILSGGRSLDAELFLSSTKLKKWDIFKIKVLHLLHLNAKCYIRNGQHILRDLTPLKIKLINVGIICQPPNQSNFL